MGIYVAVIGENVADAIVEAPSTSHGRAVMHVYAGGGPANTAVALAGLATPTHFVSRIPGGPFGRLFRDRLEGAGVDLTHSVPAPEPATLAIASPDAAGHTTYDFYATGTADWQWQPRELTPATLTGAACIHTGSLALIMEPGGKLIEDVLEEARAHATISIDPNVRTTLIAPGRYRDRIGRWASLADIIRLSDEDFAHLYPGQPIENVFDDWHRAGVRLVIFTQGDRGAQVSLDGTRIAVSAVPVKVIDTVGAGDAFTAAVLHWLAQHDLLGGRLEAVSASDIEDALHFGVHVAAQTCAAPGASSPSLGQLSKEALRWLGGIAQVGRPMSREEAAATRGANAIAEPPADAQPRGAV